MKLLRALSLLMLTGLPAAGVTITTITCSGTTATVNCAGCGIAASQGFSIAGTSVSSYNFNGTAKVSTTNTFTFATTCAGTSTGGAVIPAKQIINTGSSVFPAGGTVTISYLFWFTSTIPIVPACAPSCVSSWPGASAAENAAISAGTTIEFPGSITVVASTSAATIETIVENQYNTAESAYASFLLAGLGFWWNGIAWINQ